MTACSHCHHARGVEPDGTVEPHEYLWIDYAGDGAHRDPCPGSGQPPRALLDLDGSAYL